MKRMKSMGIGAALIAIGFATSVFGAIDTGDRVSLDFDDTPITTVLKMLADQNDLNIVVSSSVEGGISINLEDVTLDAALNAILLPNGYNYYIHEDIIIVKEADKKVFGELDPRAYDLIYINAAAAVAALTPILSNLGQVIPLSSETRTDQSDGYADGSRLLVVDYPAVHENVAELLLQIDRKKRQVSVEVKIIETNLTDDEKLGINWPKSISTSIKGVDSPGNAADEIGTGGGTEAAVMPLETGNWQLGYLTVQQLDVVLNYLKKRSHTKLLSNPRLTTMENETASIQIQTVIPIQTVNRFSEGAVIQDIVTFQDEEVGISLEVTPRINGDSVVTLRVTPVVEEIIGYTGSTDNQKPITSERSITTTVAVKNGESLVLGGLLKESRFETKDRIFLLGSIPILGGLFTNRSTEIQTTDLLILITPRILD